MFLAMLLGLSGEETPLKLKSLAQRKPPAQQQCTRFNPSRFVVFTHYLKDWKILSGNAKTCKQGC
jgi:hypothetical protein